MRYANEAECKAAGLEPVEVERLAKALEKLAKQADAMGLTIFGGSGSGTLRAHVPGETALVVAQMQTHNFDGGDGACSLDDDGLMRGE